MSHPISFAALVAGNPNARVVPSSTVDCPVSYCQRPAGLCCVEERGAVRRGGQHPERLALEQATAGECDRANPQQALFQPNQPNQPTEGTAVTTPALTLEYHDPAAVLVDANIRDSEPDNGLIASIKAVGVLQPPVCVRTADGQIRRRSATSAPAVRWRPDCP